ncbi:MAG: hypothetical protein V1656_01015 [Candidatus Jorgensenbacteria bacterium]
MSKNKQGFAAVPLMLIVVAALAVAGGGYLVYQRFIAPRCDIASCEDIKKIAQGSLRSGQLEISSPEPNAVIVSPVVIRGQTTSMWTMFEGEAGAVLVNDGNARGLGQGILRVVGDWTKPVAEFEAIITFEESTTQSGWLTFYDANPSGDPDLTYTYTLPVRFK